MISPRREIRQVVERALAEDLGWGDVTTEALIPADQPGKAEMLVKDDGRIAGLDVVVETFAQVDPRVRVELRSCDGDLVRSGDIVGTLSGSAASILSGERVALNLLQRMSGIATTTARYVEAVAGTGAQIIDTRKTTPGLRALEKYAVRVGGGQSHRMNLSDGVLIKDNHLAAVRGRGQSLGDAVRLARTRAAHTIRVEVEVTSIDEAAEAAEARADIILLDNMSPHQMAEAVRLINGRSLVEASGGIRLESVRTVAESGVDLISVGALTHSVMALDISLELTLETSRGG